MSESVGVVELTLSVVEGELGVDYVVTVFTDTFFGEGGAEREGVRECVRV